MKNVCEYCLLDQDCSKMSSGLHRLLLIIDNSKWSISKIEIRSRQVDPQNVLWSSWTISKIWIRSEQVGEQTVPRHKSKINIRYEQVGAQTVSPEK